MSHPDPEVLAVGQQWKYSTRPDEALSRVTIFRIDQDDDEYGDIVHVYISGLEIENAAAPQGKTSFISHLPYLGEALTESLIELEVTLDDVTVLEHYSAALEGYRLWKQAFENSEAGVFTNPVAEAIGYVEKSI